jgi:hypothetical protein
MAMKLLCTYGWVYPAISEGFHSSNRYVNLCALRSNVDHQIADRQNVDNQIADHQNVDTMTENVSLI